MDLLTSKEKERKLPVPLKVTQRRPKMVTFDNSKVTSQSFVEGIYTMKHWVVEVDAKTLEQRR